MNDDLLSGKFDNNGHFAFCYIYAISPERRSCSIKTFGSDPKTSDQDYTDVQWLSAYSHPDGDEVSLIPRLYSTALCVFFDGQPWIVGFYQPLTLSDQTEIPDPNIEGNEQEGASAAINKEKINAGDFIQRTRANSRIVMRAGGEIEIEATPVCKRTYFPSENRINENSYNYEFRTNGGTIDWIQPDPEDTRTECTQLWRDSIEGTNIIIDERGTVEVDTDFIWRYRMGAGSDFFASTTVNDNIEETVPARPRVLEQMKIDGTREYFLRQPDPELETNAYETYIGTDGEYYVGINDYSYFQNIKPTGEIVVNINDVFQQTIFPDGEMQLDIGMASAKEEGIPGAGSVGKCSLNIKPTGDISLNVADKNEITVMASGEVKIDVGPGKSTLTINQDGTTTLKTEKQITCETKHTHLKSKTIDLGTVAPHPVPLGDILLTAINSFIASYNSHMHSGIPVPSGMSGPPTAPGKEIPADVLSKTVKVQP
jgi:hypothetical protein